MSNVIAYKINVSSDKGASVSIFKDGRSYVYNRDNHTEFDELLATLSKLSKGEASNEDVINLLKPEFLTNVVSAFGGKVEVREAHVIFNRNNGTSEILDGVLVDKIISFYRSKLPYEYLVNFLEKLMYNPDERSREQLYDFLERYDYPITPDGDFIAYKGLNEDYTSIHSGYGIVNGKHQNGNLENKVGNVVEIPRESVDCDPNSPCSFGLHCGSIEYVKNFSRGKIVLVKVNPADVVSVPFDCTYQKVRVCKYEVISEFESEIESEIYETVTDSKKDDAQKYEDDVNILQELLEKHMDVTIRHPAHLVNRVNKYEFDGKQSENPALLEIATKVFSQFHWRKLYLKNF